jgi:transposase-like protein
MKTTRKRYSADFKAKVALEAIRGDLTLAELAAKHCVHHTMIAPWKRRVIDGMAGTFPVRAMWPRPPAKARWRSCTPRSGNWSSSGIF